MFAYIKNKSFQYLIPPGTPFTIDDVQYPANWMNLSTPEEKAAAGIVDVVYGTYPNDQYYWVSQDEPVYANGVVTINYTTTPKDLDACKTYLIDSTNKTAYTILFPSDWMVVKSVETGLPMNIDWNTWRQTIRTQAADHITAIKSCTTVEELELLSPVSWVKDPNYTQS